MSLFQAPLPALLSATLLAIAAGGEAPTEGPYVGAQAAIWNRVHRALFHRVGADGQLRGERELDPLLFSSSTWPLAETRANEIESALTALVDAQAAIASSSGVARAILQRDLWAWHDWLERNARQDATTATDRAQCERLRTRCAAVMRAVALAPEELKAVDTALAVAIAQTGDDLRPLLEEQAIGAWVRLAYDADAGPLALSHSLEFGARSAFSVHMRTPGGREETLKYLAQLASAELTVNVDGELRLSPRLPQPPVGTRVALVRRAIHVDRSGQLHVLALVESLQIRKFPRFDPPAVAATEMARYDGAFWRALQEVRELDLDRASLLAGHSGLREVGADEPHLSSFGSHGEDPLDDARSTLHPRLQTCVGCHGASGMHSMVSFTRVLGGPGTHLEARLSAPPRQLVADTTDGWRTRALEAARADTQLAQLLKGWSR